MKKILTTISTLFIASIIYAQAGLDTVFVRTLQLKGEEWWWVIDGIEQRNLDSIGKKQYKRVVNLIDAANISSSTNFTIDSLPGPFAMIGFRDYWSHPEARENMGQGIDTKLRAYAPLAPYIANADAQRLARFTNRKNRGRHTVD